MQHNILIQATQHVLVNYSQPKCLHNLVKMRIGTKLNYDLLKITVDMPVMYLMSHRCVDMVLKTRPDGNSALLVALLVTWYRKIHGVKRKPVLGETKLSQLWVLYCWEVCTEKILKQSVNRPQSWIAQPQNQLHTWYRFSHPLRLFSRQCVTKIHAIKNCPKWSLKESRSLTQIWTHFLRYFLKLRVPVGSACTVGGRYRSTLSNTLPCQIY